METKLYWYNLPSETISLFYDLLSDKTCLDDEELKKLINDLSWFNLPNKVFLILDKIEELFGYTAPDKLQWYNLPNTIASEYDKIKEINCPS